MEADLEHALRHGSIPREAMKHTADLAGALLLENPERVLLCLSGVNHDRPFQPPRQPDLLAEDLLLDVAWREVVVIVESDLADGPGQRLCVERLLRALRGFGRVGGKGSGGMRMNANPESGVAPQPRHLSSLPKLGIVVCGQYHQRSLYSRRARARDHGLEVAREFRTRNVAV